MKPRDILQDSWGKRGILACLLLPLGGIFFWLAALRRMAYQNGWLHSERLAVPVVVIGNITVGGSGKTPLTLWLAQRLQQSGRRPGIVSRGYGGSDNDKIICEVTASSLAREVGDEPVLLKRRSGLPVFVGRDRVAAARALLAAYPKCDLLLCDDGLQHYRLARDVEIAVLDGRGLQNGWPLPAGPLREPAARLGCVDALVFNGDVVVPQAGKPTFLMSLAGKTFYRLDDPPKTCDAAALAPLRLAALAGIGVPERFFGHLEKLGLKFSRHVFPDHHRFTREDLSAIDADALLMTEKDAVKCAGLGKRIIWVLPVTAQVAPSGSGVDLVAHVEHCIEEKLLGPPPA
jgi:tetraacyldisaccharide 4'-kinase